MPPRPSHSVLYWLRRPFISLQRHRLASRAAVRHPIRIYERVSMLGVGEYMASQGEPFLGDQDFPTRLHWSF